MSEQFSQPPKIEQVRYSETIGRIVCRLAVMQPACEDDFASFYEGGSYDFWKAYLFGIQSIESFTRTLALTGSEDFHRIEVRKLALKSAMISAYQSDEPWFRGRVDRLRGVTYFREVQEPETVKVISLEAANWLLRAPNYQHLVPQTLKQFLQGKVSAAYKKATNEDITAAVRQVYAEAGFKKPNVVQAWRLARDKLNIAGLTATRDAVDAVTEQEEFKTQRAAPGSGRKKSI